MGDVAALRLPLTGPGGLLNNTSSSIRRCLFGPVDHEKATVHFEQQMDEIMEQNKLRWNFDFLNEKPLPPGRYLWEKVENPPVVKPPVKDNPDKDTQEIEEKSSKKQEQTHITDFMRKRKSSNNKDFVTLPSKKCKRRSST